MFFGSYLEFISILLFIVVFNIAKRLTNNNAFLTLLLSAGNLVILSTLVDIKTLSILSVLIIITFYSARKMGDMATPQRRRKTLLYLVLGTLIFLFCVRNYPWFADLLSRYSFMDAFQAVSVVGRIGLSYILFRLLHFLVDAYRGKINEFDIFSFYNYIFFFPTFLSGPIDRYNNFHFWQYRDADRYLGILQVQGVGKIFVGAVKKMILVPLVIDYTTDVSLFSEVTSDLFWQLSLSVLAYSFYIYFDFSGYSDIAIGTAYLIGIKTPENFRNPYFSGNISEFWKKWHISFSSILTEYIFKPFVIRLSAMASWAPRLAVSVTGYLYTFIICGLWHGSTLNFVYWGLWHGIGLAIYKVWEKIGWWNRLESYRIYHPSRVLLTFVFVTIGWFFFMTNTNKVHAILHQQIGSIEKEYLPSSEMQLTASSNYWEGYGWGIQLKYQPDMKRTLDVEYRLLGQPSWSKGISAHSMESGHFDIHGTVVNGKDLRNVATGWYEVRYRMDNEAWIGSLVVIPDYQKSNP